MAPDDPKNGPSFVATLVDQKVIDRKMVGIMITGPDQGGDSTITMGGYDDT